MHNTLINDVTLFSMRSCVLRVTKLLLLSVLLISSIDSVAKQVSQYEIQVVTELLEPYQVYNHDGTLGGFSTDVIKALLQQAQSTAKIEVMPWARAYNTALYSENVMIYSITKSDSRDRDFLWLGEIFEEKLCYWTLRHNGSENKLVDKALKDKAFSAPRFSISAQYLLDNNFTNVYLTSNEEQSIEMLFLGRADFILATEYSLRLAARKLGLDLSKVKRMYENKVISNPLSIAFGLNTDREIIEHFQAAFSEIKRNGTLGKITQKWNIERLAQRCN